MLAAFGGGWKGMTDAVRRVYRRIRYGKPIVVVSGLPRSGTSMAMKMLEAGGLSVVTDGLRAPDEDNPKGYFEDERVKRLHKEEDKAWLHEARGKVVKIISFLLKSLPPEHNYKVVLMQRNLREIVASQNKMLARLGKPNDLPDETAVQLLAGQAKDASFFLKRPQFEVLELNYADTLAGARAQAARIAEFVGQPLDVEKMASVVDAQLYRNRA
jgi:sulfotransferase family protein